MLDGLRLEPLGELPKSLTVLGSGYRAGWWEKRRERGLKAGG